MMPVFRVLIVNTTKRNMVDVRGRQVWERDEDVPNCRICDREFTVLTRRHHCRVCGRIVCAKCSK